MTRLLRLTSVVVAAAALALVAAACGTQHYSNFTSKSDASYASDNQMASLFHERCGGCHTLSYAGANGSGNNPRTYLAISGPNFNVRCERPVARVLYAIENGGFGGAYMPANIVVGAQARQLAMFVSKFAGRQAPIQPDTTPCDSQVIGNLPANSSDGVNIATQTSTTPAQVSGNSSADVGGANPSPGGGT